MNTYFLKIKESDKESLLKYSCDSYDEACEYFSIIKNLEINELLRIYVVV